MKVQEIRVANVKINKSMSDETLCFSASLFVRLDDDPAEALENPGFLGTKIGTVMNRGHGGPNEYQIDDAQTEQELREWANGQTVIYPAHNGMEAFELTFGKLDHFVDVAVEEFEDKKWFKRNCKNKTLFRLTTDGEDSWRTVTAPFSDDVKNFIETKYGDKVAEIANLTRI